MKKSAIAGILIVIVAGSIVGAGFALGWFGDKTGLPTSDVPDASLTFTNGGDEETISLSTIVEYINNETIPLIEYEYEIDDGVTVNLAGINPIYLYEIMGWYDVNETSFIASDDFASKIDVGIFLLADPDFNKGAVGNPNVLGLAINNKWLADYDEELGNFAIFGDELSGKQKAKDVVKVEYNSAWQVNVIVDDVIVATLNNSNIESSGLNYTTYEWGYTDNSDGYSFDTADYSGATIASIISTLTSVSGDYNVSFISIDGWGANWVYNETDIEDGLSEDNAAMINDPEEPMSNEGKQIILCNEEDDEKLYHGDGPFRVIVPGQTKNRYQTYVTEIQITTA